MEEQKRPLVFGKLTDIMEAKRAELTATHLEREALLERDGHCQDCDGICWACEIKGGCDPSFKDEIERINDEYERKNREWAKLLNEYNFIKERRRILVERADKLRLEIKKTQDTIKDLNYTKGVLESQLAVRLKELEDFESSH